MRLWSKYKDLHHTDYSKLRGGGISELISSRAVKTNNYSKLRGGGISERE